MDEIKNMNNLRHKHIVILHGYVEAIEDDINLVRRKNTQTHKAQTILDSRI